MYLLCQLLTSNLIYFMWVKKGKLSYLKNTAFFEVFFCSNIIFYKSTEMEQNFYGLLDCNLK